MNCKRIAALTLAVCMAAPLSAFAEPLPDGWTPADGARGAAQEVTAPIPERYNAVITLNGERLDSVTYTDMDPDTFEDVEITLSISEIPGCPPGYVPMRLLCTADPNGFTEWIAEENSAVFSLHKNSFIVYFDDLSIELEGEKVPGVSAYLYHDGVTFIPVDFLATLPGVKVDTHPEMSTQHYDFTLEVSPLVALAESIKKETGCAANFEMTADDLVNMYEVPAGVIQEAVAYAPMMVNPDTLFIVKVPAAQQDAVKAAFEAYIAQQVETFTWYLPGQLPKAQDGKVAVQDDYMMLYIGEDSAAAVEMFTAGVAALGE